MTRRLYYTPGSPFARAIRIMLDELGLAWEPELANIKDSAQERSKRTPTLQVPTLFDGGFVLWDSGLIAEYLLSAYRERPPRCAERPLARAVVRPEHEWADKLLFATVQTLGESIVLVSQARWAGTTAKQNAFIARSADRVVRLLDWLEARLPDQSGGFLPGVLSIQDIFCICHVMFVTHRPLDIEWDRTRTPKLSALHERLGQRPSFRRNTIEWWEPGMPA